MIFVGGCTEQKRAPAEASAGSSRLSELLSGDGAEGYAQAREPRDFSFPRDHGPHPAFRNEWWYLTGNLDGGAGERFGFELTIFRFALTPLPAQVEVASAWRNNQVYIGHFAITDVARGDFHVADRYARAALGLAGAEAKPFRVWLENWFLRRLPEGAGLAETPSAVAAQTAPAWLLHAAEGDVALTLSLNALKPPVLNGIDGLSQKSQEPGNASYYYSIPRLQAAGTIALGDRVYDVTGLAWLDREWSSSALSAEQQGWDWFALQLVDGSDLMFYNLRRTDGSRDPHSAGTWIPAEGDAVHLRHDDVEIAVHDTWASPLGGRYPMAWTVAVPDLDLSLDIEPVMQAQELATAVRYWEGAVDVSGVRNGSDITGRGYVELTGYADD